VISAGGGYRPAVDLFVDLTGDVHAHDEVRVVDVVDVHSAAEHGKS
jgi:hypothetical protein